MTKRQTLRLKYIFADIVAVILSWWLINIGSFKYDSESTTTYTVFCLFISLIIYIPIFALSGYYNEPFAKSRIKEFVTTIISVLIGAIIISNILYLPILWSGTQTLATIIISFICVYLLRLSITQLERYRGRKGKVWDNVLLISHGKIGDMTESWLKEKSNKRIVGKSDFDKKSILSQMSYAIKYRGQCIDEIVIASDNIDVNQLDELLEWLIKMPVRIFISARGLVRLGIKTNVDSLYGEPLVNITKTNMSESGKNIKWLFDKLVSAILLIVLSPLFIVLSIIVKFDSEGDVFYSQERIGLNGKPFMIYKFRSMIKDAEGDTPSLCSKDDTRITRSGRWMRRYRLDELPQLYNVLRGDMSIVGPRPERKYYADQIVTRCPNYRLLSNIKPGITSWGIVRYGYASNVDQMVERFAYDWIYYENMSIMLDISVLAYTIRTLIKGLGK